MLRDFRSVDPNLPHRRRALQRLQLALQLDTSIYRLFGGVEVAGAARGKGAGRRLRLVSVVRWPALWGQVERQASAGWRCSQSRRRMLWTRLASPILVVARARPMVRTNSPILAFCSAKTCSM
jgi:hypothetical protein